MSREPKNKDEDENEGKYEINYLSNDVENILIEQAFKLRKLQDSCQRNDYYPATTNPYYYVNSMGYYQEYDYSYSQTLNQNAYHVYDPFSAGYQNASSFSPITANPHFNVIYEEGDEVNQLRKNFDYYNLVETRKNTHRFTNKKNNKWSNS